VLNLPVWCLLWRTTNDRRRTKAPKKSAQELQNSIDTLFILPQYLGLEDHSLLQVGLVFQIQGPKSAPLQGKIERRKLHGNQEEGKEKEETLTVGETISRTYTTNFTGLSREAPLEGLFRLRSSGEPWGTDRALTARLQ